MVFCTSCGNEIESGTRFCPKCGAGIDEKSVPITSEPTHVRSNYVVTNKNAGLAAVLSFLFCGLGQIYAGKITKGLLFIFVGLLLGVATFIFILPGVAAVAFWIYNIYDAYTLTNEYNTALETTGRRPW